LPENSIRINNFFTKTTKETKMTAYEIPREFDVSEYPFELRNQVGHYLNTHMGQYTIPQIAKALGAEEAKVAWVLTNLCELTSPEVIVDSLKGKEYWEHAIKLKGKSPRSFNEKTVFLGRVMR
jgi:hypothetical protein